MKQLLVIFIMVAGYAATAQVGIGTSTPNPNAILDVKSATKGILIPRVDSFARFSMANIKGMILYDTTTNSFWFSTGNAWKSLVSSDVSADSIGNFWTTRGNSGTTDGTSFLGTKDNTALSFRVNNELAGRIDNNNGGTFFGIRAGRVNNGLGNMAIGYEALFSNTSGSNNTVSGTQAMYANTGGQANVAIGSQPLYSNTNGSQNIAIGNQAMYYNTSGSDNVAIGKMTLGYNKNGIYNVATGNLSLFSNINGSFNVSHGYEAMKLDTSGSFNTVNGYQAMYSNLSGGNNNAYGGQSLYSVKTAYYNNAVGYQAMYSDTSGNFNTAMGHQTMYSNTNGFQNAAFGDEALYSNNTASFNTAIGSRALFNNSTGGQNTAVGTNALFVNNGSNNIGIGFNAGNQINTGNYNIDIGNNGVGGESNTIRIGSNNQSRTFIGGIYGAIPNAGVALFIDGSGQLGTNPSSARFKEDITNMGITSMDLYKLRPVTFHYKEEISKGDRSMQYGLIAEEVEKINPNLVAYDNEGKIFSVKYHLLVPLMLNELQKEHRQNKQQAEKLTSLQQQINELKRAMGNGRGISYRHGIKHKGKQAQ